MSERLAMAAATRRQVARFIVTEAVAAGISIGTDGDDLLCLIPMRLPREMRVQFTRAFGKYRSEIVTLLHNGGRV